MDRLRRGVVTLSAAAAPVSTSAQAENSTSADPADAALAPVVVTAQAAPRASSLDPNLPASVNTVTADQFQYWNVTTPEDVLKYAPNMAVRKRFIGDPNATIAVRGTSNSQTARGLVYADGLLLSNFLGNTWTFAPRWSMRWSSSRLRSALPSPTTGSRAAIPSSPCARC